MNSKKEKKEFPYDIIPKLSVFCTRPMTMQRDIIAIRLFCRFKNARFISLPLDGKSRSLLVEKEGKQAAYRAALESINTENKWKKHVSDYDRCSKELLLASKMLAKEKDSKLLAGHYKKFIGAIDNFSIFLLMPFAIEEFIDAKLRQNASEDILSVISFPSELNQYQKMRLDIIDARLKNKYSANQLAKKYGWYNEYSYLELLLDENHFKRKISELTKKQAEQEQKSILEPIISNMKEFPKALKRIKDKKTRLLAEIVHKYTFIRADRLDTLKKAQVNVRQLFMKIAKQAGIRYDLVPTFTTKEILGYLTDNILPLIDELEKRARHEYVLYSGEEEHIFYDGFKDITKKIFELQKKDDIKGLVAFKGLAKGKARIILSKHDLAKIKEGDILVAKTTMPDYTPAMKKSAAIVTDDGGITSHAAIVSRELKKPCIVGTGNATTNLKDNDYVEVDANNGVVRKLKSK